MLRMQSPGMRRALLGLAALTLAAAPHAAGADTLRWKFKPGETLRYAMDQKTVTTLKLSGQQLQTTLNQTIDLSWAVTAVAENGTADVTWTIDRMRTKIEAGLGTFSFDSDDKKPPEGPIANALVPTIRALVGAKFTFKIDPLGKMSDVKVDEKVTKMLKDAGAAASGTSSAFSEEGLKNMIIQSSLGVPEGDLSPDQTWTDRVKIPSPPIGSMVLDKTYRYTGPAPDRGSDVAKIVLETKVSIEPDPDANVRFEINDQDARGEFYFDRAAGKVVESDVTEKLETTAGVQNMKIVQILDTRTTMKLAKPEPAKDEAAAKDAK